jgi:hypothetical protein
MNDTVTLLRPPSRPPFSEGRADDPGPSPGLDCAARLRAPEASRSSRLRAPEATRSSRLRERHATRFVMALLLAALVPLLMPATLHAGVSEVKLKLPVKPKLKITGDEKIVVAPFIIVIPAEKGNKADRAAKVDVQTEFGRYLRKELTKSTKLKVVDAGPTRLPGGDMKALEANRDYWKELAAKHGADYVVSGMIDFDINDRSGYKAEEYVSPVDGKTYYRQVLVETTGFVFDIVIAVFDGDTGEKVLEENFRDFKEFDQQDYDELLGLFENLRSLETQLLGIFVSQEQSATRYVFTE